MDRRKLKNTNPPFSLAGDLKAIRLFSPASAHTRNTFLSYSFIKLLAVDRSRKQSAAGASFASTPAPRYHGSTIIPRSCLLLRRPVFALREEIQTDAQIKKKYYSPRPAPLPIYLLLGADFCGRSSRAE
jgi:hypothetical protein